MSETFRRFALERLSQAVPRVRGKSMFGGVGIYSGEWFFALIAGEILYLKVDDDNRAQFEALGSAPFKPFADKPMTMSYYDVPLELLESGSRLQPYAEAAVAAAQRAAVAKAAGKKRSRSTRRRP